jgi:transposase
MRWASQLTPRRRQIGLTGLDPWSKACRLQNFAAAIREDYGAIRAAPDTIWPNDQTEEQVNRSETLKRQMHGRASLDQLRIRVLYASSKR